MEKQIDDEKNEWTIEQMNERMTYCNSNNTINNSENNRK